MIDGPILVDSDMLSEISRGHRRVIENARAYLARHGRLTVSAVSVFERLRGYRAALREGKPFESQLQQFQAFAACCIVLPIDVEVADMAATIWAQLSRRRRSRIGDILIGATACARGLPMATRNRRDFEPIMKGAGVEGVLVDWTR